MGTNSFNTTDESIRTTAAAYLLAVGQAALEDFAQARSLDFSTMVSLHQEAVEALVDKWDLDQPAVQTEANVAAVHLSSRTFVAKQVDINSLHA